MHFEEFSEPAKGSKLKLEETLIEPLEEAESNRLRAQRPTYILSQYLEISL